MRIIKAILFFICFVDVSFASFPPLPDLKTVNLVDKPVLLEEEWPSSSPEKQGMDSAIFEDLRQVLKKDLTYVRSVLIIRNGHLVFEYYGKDLGSEDMPPVFSVSKSVTSALIGVALQKGLIRSVDQPLSDFFPESSGSDVDPRVRRLTLANLLSMSSGFEWDEDEWFDCMYNEKTLKKDCSKYGWEDVNLALKRPMDSPAGKKFNYDDMNAFLLSMVLKKVSGMSVSQFAEKHLFKPLGIPRYSWQTNPQGDAFAGRGLSLRSRDMAKLGQLYLDKGRWKGLQIIPEDYVQSSVTSKISFPSRRPPPGSVEHYGYLWWVYPTIGAFGATGYGGQQITVLPSLDMMVVVTNSTPNNEKSGSWIVDDYVVPAIIQ